MLCICLAILFFLGTVTPAALAEPASVFRTEPMVSAGEVHTVALRSDGMVWAWGANPHGQVGDGSMSRRYTPVQVQNLTNVIAVSAGFSHTAALRSDGTVWVWGWHGYGEPDTMASSATPVQVQSLTDVIAISAGNSHTAALRSDGTVWTWGWNGHGQLGDGTTTTSHTPVQVQALTGVAAVSAGVVHTVALRNDGTVWAWGNNEYGQLGDGTTMDRHMPVQVESLTDVIAVSAGLNTVALRDDGTVWVWGWNEFGQLGDGTTTDRHTPVQIQALTDVIAVSMGWVSPVALQDNGTVWRIDHDTPVQVQSLTNVRAISAGGHQVALRDDGTVWAWGRNDRGQLGDGTGTNRHTPTQVVGSDGVGFLNLMLGDTPFTDVPLHAWFHDAVAFVYDQGIMSGTSPTTFAPNADFSREMVVATLFRMYYGRSADNTDARDTPFSDVDESRWYAPYIAWGYSESIVTGTSPDTFGIGNAVSRQDFAVLLHRFANFTDMETDVPEDFTLSFPDADSVGSWAEDALIWAVYAELITGTGQGLAPTGTATRAQAATMLMRYAQAFAE